MSTLPPAVPGKSLFESRTVWSLILAMVFTLIPSALSWVGVPIDQQGGVITSLHQIIPPLAMVAGVIFHAISTKPVTSILPTAKPPPGAAAFLVVFLLAGSLLGSGFLSGCATTANTRVTAAKADAVSWAALQSVANTLDGLAVARVIHGQQALTVADWLNRAQAFLTAADAAYQRGDNATASQNLSLATSLVTALIQIASHPDQPLPAAPAGALGPPPTATPAPASFLAPAVPLALHDLRVAIVVAHSRKA